MVGEGWGLRFWHWGQRAAWCHGAIMARGSGVRKLQSRARGGRGRGGQWAWALLILATHVPEQRAGHVASVTGGFGTEYARGSGKAMGAFVGARCPGCRVRHRLFRLCKSHRAGITGNKALPPVLNDRGSSGRGRHPFPLPARVTHCRPAPPRPWAPSSIRDIGNTLTLALPCKTASLSNPP